MLGSAIAALALAASLGTGCGLSASDSQRSAARDPGTRGPRSTAAPSGLLRMRAAERITAPHVVGDRVSGLPGTRAALRLAQKLNSPFTTNLAPAAVSRPGDARTLAYHAFRAGRPVIRRFDLARGEDTVIAEGAFSVAWRRDGTLAYFQGLRTKVGDPGTHRGHVVVRRLGARSVRWTSRPGRYVVAAWARDILIAYRLTELSADVLAFDGPRRPRVLARGAFLVALAPDGRTALTSRAAPAGPIVELVDVTSGEGTARLPVVPASGADPSEPATFVAGGSWVGDRVVGATNVGLLVFRVRPGRIRLEQFLSVDRNVFPTGLQEPRLGADARRILAWGELTARPRQAVPDAALVDCDRMTLHCRRGAVAPALEPPRPLYNPSRP